MQQQLSVKLLQSRSRHEAYRLYQEQEEQQRMMPAVESLDPSSWWSSQHVSYLTETGVYCDHMQYRGPEPHAAWSDAFST